MQYSRCGLTSTKERGIITSLHLLAMFLLIQPRMLLPFFSAGASRCWPMVRLLSARTPGLSSRAASQPVSPQPVSLQGALPSQVQGFAFVLEFHKAPDGPCVHSAKVPLNGSPIFMHINYSPQFGIICKHKSALYHLLRMKPCSTSLVTNLPI